METLALKAEIETHMQPNQEPSAVSAPTVRCHRSFSFGFSLLSVLIVPFLWGASLAILCLATYRLFKTGPADAWMALRPVWLLLLLTVAWTSVAGCVFKRLYMRRHPPQP